MTSRSRLSPGKPPFPTGAHRIVTTRPSGLLRGAPRWLRGPYSLLFPTGVRVWHFILVPAFGMALVTGFFRLVDGLVPPGAAAGTEVYAPVAKLASGRLTRRNSLSAVLLPD